MLREISEAAKILNRVNHKGHEGTQQELKLTTEGTEEHREVEVKNQNPLTTEDTKEHGEEIEVAPATCWVPRWRWHNFLG